MDLASLLYGRLDRSWQAQANCMGVDPDLFFPERGASTREAKEVCRGCVVREDCLEYALANGEKFGIWGGMSERERRRLRRARALQRRAVGDVSRPSWPPAGRLANLASIVAADRGPAPPTVPAARPRPPQRGASPTSSARAIRAAGAVEQPRPPRS